MPQSRTYAERFGVTVFCNSPAGLWGKPRGNKNQASIGKRMKLLGNYPKKNKQDEPCASHVVVTPPAQARTSRRRAAAILLTLVLGAGLGTALAEDTSEGHHQGHQSHATKFAVLSDVHFFDARLGTTGPAFENYVAQDPKLLALSEPILDAALQSIVTQHVQFVLVTGDLTKDGELVDHERVAKRLKGLEHHGIQVFVVPGNHDINNPDAVSYDGATTTRVPNVSPKKFREIYERFGYDQAIDRDEHSLSYVAEPVHGLWLLGIDSCKYEESKQLGYPIVGGAIKPQTMTWVLHVLAEAKEHGKQVIAFMHHGVNQHFLGEAQIFPDYLVDDWANVSAQLAHAGLKVVFTGHYHSQDAAYPLDANGVPMPTLCDVETGSLAQYPCAFRMVTLDATGLSITSQRVTEIDADTGGVPFQQYALNFLQARLPALATYQLMTMFNLPQADAAQAAPLVAGALIANYAGNETPDAQTQAMLNAFVQSPEPLHTLGLMLWGLWGDLPPADNQLTLSW